MRLPNGESIPGLPRDRRGYSPGILTGILTKAGILTKTYLMKKGTLCRYFVACALISLILSQSKFVAGSSLKFCPLYVGGNSRVRVYCCSKFA